MAREVTSNKVTAKAASTLNVEPAASSTSSDNILSPRQASAVLIAVLVLTGGLHRTSLWAPAMTPGRRGLSLRYKLLASIR
jgi:hypothetical protein